MTRSTFVKAAAVITMAGATFAPVTAQAQNTIFNFTGSANIFDPNPAIGAGNTLIIDFLLNGNTTGGTPGTIAAIEETDLAGVAIGQTGSILDLTAVPGGFAPAAVPGFVTIGGFTFNLTGSEAGNVFGPISLSQVGTTVIGSFNVNGTAAGGTLGPNATFFGSFTTQFNRTTVAQVINTIDAGNIVNRSFSATFEITDTVIPEPSTYALMASGVVMLGAFARRRRQA